MIDQTITNNALIEDQQLLEACAKGDEESFYLLVNQYKDYVYSFCCRFLKLREYAGICAEKTFEKAYHHSRKSKCATPLLVWLYRIAYRNCFRVYNSKEFRYRAEEASSVGDSANGKYADYRSGNILEELFDALPVEQKVPIMLKDVEGFSYEDIGTIMGITPASVYDRVANARQKILDYLKQLI